MKPGLKKTLRNRNKIAIMTILVFAVLAGCKKQVTETVAVYTYQDTWRTYPADELVERYYRQRNYEEALEYAESALRDIEWGQIESDARGFWINAVIGDCYVQTGKSEEGKTYIDTAVKGYEDAGETEQGYFFVCYIEGQYYLKTNQYESALEYFEKSLKYAGNLKNTDSTNELDIAKIYCDMGVTYMKLDNMDAAIENLKRSYDIVGKQKLESEVAFSYYKDVMEPNIKDLYEKSADGEIGYEQWFSENFK